MAVRSFVALEISDEVKEKLGRLLGELQRTNATIKWVEVENLHLTLKFLGEVPESQIEDIAETLKAVAQGTFPFSFTVQGVSGFPDLRKPRVLWVGVEATEALMRLQRMVEKAMENLGFEPEGRGYHPHITIGRVKAMVGIEKVKTILSENVNTVFGVVFATHLTLFRSDLSKEGPTYTPLAKLPFASKEK